MYLFAITDFKIEIFAQISGQTSAYFAQISGQTVFLQTGLAKRLDFVVYYITTHELLQYIATPHTTGRTRQMPFYGCI